MLACFVLKFSGFFIYKNVIVYKLLQLKCYKKCALWKMVWTVFCIGPLMFLVRFSNANVLLPNPLFKNDTCVTRE